MMYPRTLLWLLTNSHLPSLASSLPSILSLIMGLLLAVEGVAVVRVPLTLIPINLASPLMVILFVIFVPGLVISESIATTALIWLFRAKIPPR